MTVEFINESELRAALQDVRSDGSDTDWCLFSYENPKSQKIVLLGKGSGGIEEMKQLLKEDIVGYGLVRKTDKIDDSITVKFAFIMWLPEDVPRMQKARISVQKGKILEFIGQFHVDIQASVLSELSDQIVKEKIMDTSGSGSRVLNTSGAKELSSQASSSFSGSRATTSASRANKGALEFADSDGLKRTLQEVRNNIDGLTWVLLTYDGEDSNTITLLAKGSGDIDTDLIVNLNDRVVAYGLVRKVEKIDETEAVKFCFIRFVGENINRMLRARLGTHFGAVTAFFNPYHVSIDATETNEISDERIMKTITNASGTSVHVLANQVRTTSISPSPQVTPKSSNTTKAPVIPKTIASTNQAVQLKDEAEIKSDLRSVRSEAADFDWVLLGYEGGKGSVLVSLAKGSGGVNGMLNELNDKIVAYGLVRKREKIDESITVKFAHIVWIGDNIDRMHRARLGTHKGFVQNLFLPYHVDMTVSSKEELSDEIVERKIAEASGTALNVKS